MIQNRRQRFLHSEFCRVDDADVNRWENGSLGYACKSCNKYELLFFFFFCIFTGDLWPESPDLCSLCALSSSCQHSPLDSEVSQLGDVYKSRKLDLHCFPPMPPTSSPLVSLYNPWSEQTPHPHQAFLCCGVTLLIYYRFVQNVFHLQSYCLILCMCVCSAAKSCLTLCNPMDCCPWNSPGKNNGVGCRFLL